VAAVDGLDLTVHAGQVFGLLGLNGAGKTTTLRILVGLARPTDGSALVFGEPVEPGAPVLRRVGSLVDSPGFAPHLSARANLELHWNAGGGAPGDGAVADALRISRLGDAEDRPVKGYSFGMRQRLGLARALLGRPPLLVLDEPTTGLDPQQVKEVRGLIRAVARNGTTVLLSSHVLAEVEQVCSHAAVIDRGKLVASGTVADLSGAASTLFVEVDDVPTAMLVLGAIPGIAGLRLEGSGILVELGAIERKRVTEALVGAGVGVETVTSRHQLEDAFLGLLELAGPSVTTTAALEPPSRRDPPAALPAPAAQAAALPAPATAAPAAPLATGPQPRATKAAEDSLASRAQGPGPFRELRLLLSAEARMQLRRPRTWVSLAFVSVVPVLITAAFALGGASGNPQTSSIGNFLPLVRQSGLDMPLAALDAMAPFLLVVVVSLFAGEALTAEANWGTLRALLTRPASRGRLLAAKALVAAALSMASCLLVAITGLLSGVIAFGWHVVVAPGAVLFTQVQTLERLVVVVAYVFLALSSTGAFALLLSTVTDSVLGAVAGGIGFAVVSEILDSIPALGSARVVLPTHLMMAWGGLFTRPEQIAPMAHGLLVQLPYVSAFCAAAWWWFDRKDVLS
jgi:ABC-type multidrug transport system ATPase subunit/ABC-type transport system involved in multi-copper enzyme maturation permease subunit